MSTTGTLPFTGAGVALGSIVLGQGTIVAIALGLIVVGALAVRFGFRRGQTPLDTA